MYCLRRWESSIRSPVTHLTNTSGYSSGYLHPPNHEGSRIRASTETGTIFSTSTIDCPHQKIKNQPFASFSSQNRSIGPTDDCICAECGLIFVSSCARNRPAYLDIFQPCSSYRSSHPVQPPNYYKIQNIRRKRWDIKGLERRCV